MATDEQVNAARQIVINYTTLASATGAFPFPAASAAVVAENGAMFQHIAAAMGEEISVGSVLQSISVAGSLNFVGRAIFIEAARLLSWGTGSVWAFPALCALGAATAGLQTYVFGRIAIAIGCNNGKALNPSAAAKVVAEAKKSFKALGLDKKTSKQVPKLRGAA